MPDTDIVMTGHTVILKTSDDQVIAIYRDLANEAQATSWANDKIQFWNDQNSVRRTPVHMRAMVYDTTGTLVTRIATNGYDMPALFEVVS